jgi:hypothetical protein
VSHERHPLTVLIVVAQLVAVAVGILAGIAIYGAVTT